MPNLGPWPLQGTVKPYHRHVLVCTGHSDWPARLEEMEGLVGDMAREVRALKTEVESPPKLTACDLEPIEAGGLDVVVLPDAIRYQSVDKAAWDRIRSEHLLGEGPVTDLGPTPLSTGWLLVCVHGRRDERCGTHGVALRAALIQEVARRGSDRKVAGVSHVGGHKYAANLIAYPEGIWYGYLEPSDAPTLLDALAKGEELPDLCRGRMCSGCGPASS